MKYTPLGKLFAQLAKTYVGLVSNALQHVGIDRYYYVLFVLAQAEKSICQKELAELVYSDKPNMVRIIDYLEENQCVKRVLNPNDRREQFIELTEKGRQIAAEAEKAYQQIDADFFIGQDAESQQQVRLLLEQIAETTEQTAKPHVTVNFKTHTQ
jgi:DNA-binding MarR family transcriptional regulator